MTNLANIWTSSPKSGPRSTRKPVVALESTILSHGMPYPENLSFAAQVEEIVRENGAVPATMAIIGH